MPEWKDESPHASEPEAGIRYTEPNNLACTDQLDPLKTAMDGESRHCACEYKSTRSLLAVVSKRKCIRYANNYSAPHSSTRDRWREQAVSAGEDPKWPLHAISAALSSAQRASRCELSIPARFNRVVCGSERSGSASPNPERVKNHGYVRIPVWRAGLVDVPRDKLRPARAVAEICATHGVGTT